VAKIHRIRTKLALQRTLGEVQFRRKTLLATCHLGASTSTDQTRSCSTDPRRAVASDAAVGELRGRAGDGSSEWAIGVVGTHLLNRDGASRAHKEAAQGR
jgi:hypothetical protein